MAGRTLLEKNFVLIECRSWRWCGYISRTFHPVQGNCWCGAHSSKLVCAVLWQVQEMWCFHRNRPTFFLCCQKVLCSQKSFCRSLLPVARSNPSKSPRNWPPQLMICCHMKRLSNHPLYNWSKSIRMADIRVSEGLQQRGTLKTTNELLLLILRTWVVVIIKEFTIRGGLIILDDLWF